MARGPQQRGHRRDRRQFPGVQLPAPISCGADGSDCSASYFKANTESLTATPAPGYVFSGWSGACEGQGAVCTLSITNHSWHETEAHFDYQQVAVDPIPDQQLSQNFSAFKLQANATSSAGTITWSVTSTRPDAVDVSIDPGTGELTVSPRQDGQGAPGFGNAEIEVFASLVDGHSSSTRFGLVVTMPDNPVFACGTGVETQTGDSLPGSYTLFEFGQTRPVAM